MPPAMAELPPSTRDVAEQHAVAANVNAKKLYDRQHLRQHPVGLDDMIKNDRPFTAENASMLKEKRGTTPHGPDPDRPDRFLRYATDVQHTKSEAIYSKKYFSEEERMRSTAPRLVGPNPEHVAASSLSLQ